MGEDIEADVGADSKVEETLEAEKESDAISESFDDWVNTRVCLSPTLHIVIYRFEVIKERKDTSIPLLRYCIDDRFEAVVKKSVVKYIHGISKFAEACAIRM